MLTDVKWMTATEKEKVLKQWEIFLKNKLEFKHFTKILYHHLIMHCSFIAHFNREGFYDRYFRDPDRTLKFLSQFDLAHGAISIEMGMTSWRKGDYEDINTAMCKLAAKHIPKYKVKLKGSAKQRDISSAQLLLKRHGIELKI